MPCRDHLGEVAALVDAAAPELRDEARFIGISFESQRDLEEQRDALHENLFEICSDARRATYAAFGLPRVGSQRLFGWRTMRYYLGNALRGRVQRSVGSDIHQMGGDFILDREGRVRLSYLSHEPADRPPARTVVEELQRWI